MNPLNASEMHYRKRTSQLLTTLLLFALCTTVTSCGSVNAPEEHGNISNEDDATPQGPHVIGRSVDYKSDSTLLKGEIFYDENSTEKHPAILVVPEWWGNNDYASMRARKLAEMGYTAMAIDMYGDGLVVGTPSEAQAASGIIYSDPDLLRSRVQAAYDVLAQDPTVDKDEIAAIGYCFGGTVVLQAAAMGIPLEAVVSFHGGLSGVKVSDKMDDVDILICHGAADPFVPQKDVDAFTAEMKDVGADFTFKAYPGASHAFTNPGSTAVGKEFDLPISYNSAADQASWEDMTLFFQEHFPAVDGE